MKKINKIVRILVISDFFLNSAWGLLAPVFAIFIFQKLTLNNPAKAAEIAGFATLCYWLVKSILQIPIGKYLDKNHGEKDDFWFMFIGLILTTVVPIGYMFSSEPWHIYVLQVVHAIGMSMYIPAWYAVFTRHIDKGEEAFEWSLDSTVLGIGAGLTGAIGGLMVAYVGYNSIFVITAVANLFSGLLFLYIYKELSLGENVLHKIFPSRSL